MVPSILTAFLTLKSDILQIVILGHCNFQCYCATPYLLAYHVRSNQKRPGRHLFWESLGEGQGQRDFDYTCLEIAGYPTVLKKSKSEMFTSRQAIDGQSR